MDELFGERQNVSPSFVEEAIGPTLQSQLIEEEEVAFLILDEKELNCEPNDEEETSSSKLSQSASLEDYRNRLKTPSVRKRGLEAENEMSGTNSESKKKKDFSLG